ncbi:hypothetical protein B7494_g3095 [Chlorociboria aeruginascens]|nr:hypothetical protein B7494_g3095 [Chlorociboria aeruginascens]
MQFTIPALALLVTVITGTSATLSGTSCSVSHNAGNGGNQFSITWTGVPPSSEPSICGEFSDEISSIADDREIEQKGSVSCRTDGEDQPNVYTTLTLNKSSCTAQLEAISDAMSAALGVDSTGVGFTAPQCDLSGC